MHQITRNASWHQNSSWRASNKVNRTATKPEMIFLTLKPPERKWTTQQPTRRASNGADKAGQQHIRKAYRHNNSQRAYYGGPCLPVNKLAGQEPKLLVNKLTGQKPLSFPPIRSAIFKSMIGLSVSPPFTPPPVSPRGLSGVDNAALGLPDSHTHKNLIDPSQVA
ncbi:hypothetical protein Nepgr_013483 [Nepenthes gracilis]|uniref:Uncharacterized protein n=1 Tax=Nepenthes gracilis TaxID=150966 RepID=A0AAD3SJ84_NEPGR|nr:hypothetical protein Nepgr_013483 [Nepenthes gracilis]